MKSRLFPRVSGSTHNPSGRTSLFRRVLSSLLVVAMAVPFVPSFGAATTTLPGKALVPAATITVSTGAPGALSAAEPTNPADYPSIELYSQKAVASNGKSAPNWRKTAAFSLNGGLKWVKGTPTERDIVNLVTRGGQLLLATAVDAKGKPTLGIAGVTGVAGRAAVAAQPKLATEAALTTAGLAAADANVTAVAVVADGDLLRDAAGNILTAADFASGALPVLTEGAAHFYTWTALPGIPSVAAVTAVPAAGIVTYPKIEVNASRLNLMVNYALIPYDPAIAPNGKWTLSNRDGTALDPKTPVSMMLADDKGQAVAGQSWTKVDLTAGTDVPGLGADGKQVKQTYLVCRSATKISGATDDLDVYIAPSKVIKFKVNGVGRAPALKADYRKESLRVVGGTRVAVNNGKYSEPFDRDTARLGYDLSDILTADEQVNLSVIAEPTARKPASTVQTIALAKRGAKADSAAIAIDERGKVSLAKAYEAWDKDKKRWGTLKLPKLEAEDTVVVRIRLKATARQGKVSAEVPTDPAAGVESTFTFATISLNAAEVAAAKANGKEIKEVFGCDVPVVN